MFNYARLPKNYELIKDINLAASSLYNKLQNVDVNSLDISNYNKRYFGDKFKTLDTNLRIYSYILSWSVASTNVPLNEFVFVDYGGGSGMLSLLAKEFGIGTVIYNDIYDVSCKDAKVIGDSICNQADYYVLGDVDHVISFIRKNSISCNAIASYDVIEHIYDIEGFLSKLHLLSDGPLTVFMSSGANNLNPLIRNKLMKQHIEFEHEDREWKYGRKPTDTTKALLKLREKIILKYNNKLTAKEVEKLAKVTRSMIEFDIKKCVDKYLETREFPQEPNHPTNTCDPYTGNWFEHLMDPYHLKSILVENGFKVKIVGGYYGRPNNIIKRSIGTFMNLAIYVLKKQGIRIAPFFSIYGKRNITL
jgi:hypothetical protein